jgi:hypothetical protein
MPIRTFTPPEAFDPEAIVAMAEALDAACKELATSISPKWRVR